MSSRLERRGGSRRRAHNGTRATAAARAKQSVVRYVQHACGGRPAAADGAQLTQHVAHPEARQLHHCRSIRELARRRSARLTRSGRGCRRAERDGERMARGAAGERRGRLARGERRGGERRRQREARTASARRAGGVIALRGVGRQEREEEAAARAQRALGQQALVVRHGHEVAPRVAKRLRALPLLHQTDELLESHVQFKIQNPGVARSVAEFSTFD